MSKDPAFLFYAKDWLEGTSELLPEEKGVYIDLLCHQHQKGSLPVESKRLARIVGLSEPEFERIWDNISSKFSMVNSRFVNRKLLKLSKDRQESAKKKKIAGIFAVLIRTPLKAPMVQPNGEPNLKELIKSHFSSLDFIDIPEPQLTISITTWYNQMVEQMLHHTANANKEIDNNKGTPMPEIGAERVKAIASAVWSDQIWREQLCMGMTMETSQLQKWMAMFNASVCNDNIPDFNASRYKKMIRGWIIAQQAKGVKIDSGPQKQSSSAPLTRLSAS